MNEHREILGLGTDLIEIDRIEESMGKHPDRFLSKLFTEAEQKYCLDKSRPAIHFAGRFCAKEAIAKALGCGVGKDLSFLDIEIVNDERGKPRVTCSEALNKRFNNPSFLLSISHTKEIAMATVILLSSDHPSVVT